MLKKLRSLFGVQDLTEGNILRGLVRFSVPLLLGNFAQQLYSTVDSIIVGKKVPGGLAAIGATMPIVNLLILLFMAIATGAGIMVAQYFGAKDYKRLSKTIGNTLVLVLASGLLMMAVAIPAARPLLTLLKTPPEILDMSAAYMEIMFIGVLATAYYNIVSGILRGLGDSFTPLLFLLLTTILNTVLDIYFVWTLGWGVPGAAWATIISQAVSAILCLIRLFTMKGINKLVLRDLKPDFPLMKEVLYLGLPAGLTHGIFSLAMIMVQNLTNQMGTLVIEANTAVIRIDGFAMLPNFTFGMAATTYIGQNIGARKMDRVIEGSKKVSHLALGVAAALTALILLFGRTMLGLFFFGPEGHGARLSDDGDFGARLYCDFADAGVRRDHARGGRYHAFDVDIFGYDGRAARSSGLSSDLSDAFRNLAQWFALYAECFFGDELGFGHGLHLAVV